jgi:DNA-binding protein Fis
VNERARQPDQTGASCWHGNCETYEDHHREAQAGGEEEGCWPREGEGDGREGEVGEQARSQAQGHQEGVREGDGGEAEGARQAQHDEEGDRERRGVLSGTGGVLPPVQFPDLSWPTAEKAAIIHALEFSRGNKRHAARVLRIGKTSFYRKLAEYDLEGLCDELRAEFGFPRHNGHSPAPKDRPPEFSIQQAEREAIARALQHSAGKVVPASRLLKLGKTTVRRKLREFEAAGVPITLEATAVQSSVLARETAEHEPRSRLRHEAIERVRRGVPVSTAAELAGVPLRLVREWVAGEVKPRVTPEAAEQRRATIVDAWKAGGSVSDVASQIGVSSGYVRRVLREAGLRDDASASSRAISSLRQLTQGELNACVNAYAETGSLEGAARRVGLPRATIRAALEQRGVMRGGERHGPRHPWRQAADRGAARKARAA